MIPRSFKLANRTWRVRYETDLRGGPDKEACWGTSNAVEAVIRLDKSLLEPGMEEYLLSTWEHELLHALLSAHGIRDHDEVFVDGIAALRRQYEQTKRFAPAKKKPPKRRPKKKTKPA